MRALELVQFGSPVDCFSYNEHVPTPSIQSPYQLLVRVKAAGTNPVDTKIASGDFHLGSRLPYIIGADFAGVVEEVGDQVDGFKLGDAVFGSLHMPFSWCGSYAEYTLIDLRHDSVAKKPDSLSFEQAASAGIAILTAYQGIVNHSRTSYPSRRILIVGASGGVGAYGVQLAKALNHKVIGICSGKNVPFVKQMGADQVVAYTDTDQFTQFRMDHQGYFDLVFDCVGGEDYYTMLDPLLNDQGQYVSAVTPGTTHSTLSMASKLVYKHCFATHAYSMILSLPHHDFRSRIAPLFETGALRGMVQDEKENVMSLREGYKAHLKLATHRTVGKIVLQI
ncbi:Reticulon-4-interacting protein 1, mitochondrial [Choanephora cucurbitarum]|uniref:Reticulon-4-interacting protein 1, mitochondrial n=1 Tax=Choanephora cucurbitarum TaxID=101091 RepID=A0A1C7NFQ4_9FUNG|nr:Reticulon-4-interacting protein 1, mitochondrial [Choanephora cucurbitarum]